MHLSEMHLKKDAKKFWPIFKETFNNWLEREPFRTSAAISFYTIFSLPGLLVIIISLAGYFYGEEAVTRRISAEVQGMIGGDTAKDIEAMIANASTHSDSLMASLIGIGTLIFGATGVFYQLQQTLNLIWEVKPQPKNKIVKMIMDRIFSFGLILAVGFLLLVSLVLSAVLTVLSDWVSVYFSDAFNFLFRLLDISVSLAVVTLLFAAIFKILPDAKVEWRDVWIGAFVTALLFVIAKFALGLYFGHSDPASAYGAAGTIILIMLWVSYAGLILLFGAEFTRTYANSRGAKPEPLEFAVSTCDSNSDKCATNSSQTKSDQTRRKPAMSEGPITAKDVDNIDPVYPTKKDLVMERKETQAASPDDVSVTGEEDPGVGLEFLVTSNKKTEQK